MDRAGLISSHNLLPVDKTIICIPESNLQSYKEAGYEQELVTHPDTLIGIANKRHWILKNIGDCVMFDDDVVCIQTLHKKENRKVTEPDEVLAIFENLHNLAEDLGIKLYGLNTLGNPTFFGGNTCFTHSGKNYMMIGFRDIGEDKIDYYPNGEEYNHVVKEDEYANLVNIFLNRKSLIDSRYSGVISKDKRIANTGCSTFRSEENYKKSMIMMKKAFGDSIECVFKERQIGYGDGYTKYGTKIKRKF